MIASNILKLTTCTKCTLLRFSEKVHQTNWLINLTYYGISYVLTFLWPPWGLVWPWSATRWKKNLKINRKVTRVLLHMLSKLSVYPWRNSLYQNLFPYDSGKGAERGLWNCGRRLGFLSNSCLPFSQVQKNLEFKYLDKLRGRNTDLLIP